MEMKPSDPEKHHDTKEAGRGQLVAHNIFYTSCTIMEKLCDMVMNGGSWENVKSKEAVDMLQLNIEKHPSP